MAKRGRKMRWPYVVGVVMAVVILVLGWIVWEQRVEWPLYEAENVLDGDTFFTQDGLMIRLAALDAPDKELCGGMEARDLLEKLIRDQKLYIRVVAKDRFQRLLSYMYVGNRLVNEELLRSGWVAYDSPGRMLSEEMRAAGDAAKKASLGI